MKEQVLNEIVKFDSTAEYYQQLEKSILGNQSCYEATVVDGELLGMKVLVEGKHPVGLYLPNATDERRQKAEQMILDYVADPDYFERYMSIGPTANDHFVFMEQVGSGKLDLIIQLPYVVKGDTRKKQAEERRAQIEQQLAGSKYGIAYTDGTEHITQLNRSLENNLLKTVEYLTNMAYSQLGITPEIMNGTASDAVMTNYENRTIEPIVAAAVDEIRRKFLTEDDRANRESVMYFRDPFKLTPVSAVAEMADKFTRNEIMTSNEFRQAIGMKPSKDPKADELRNANISQSSEEIAAQNKTITAGRDAVERSIANQNG